MFLPRTGGTGGVHGAPGGTWWRCGLSLWHLLIGCGPEGGNLWLIARLPIGTCMLQPMPIESTCKGLSKFVCFWREICGRAPGGRLTAPGILLGFAHLKLGLTCAHPSVGKKAHVCVDCELSVKTFGLISVFCADLHYRSALTWCRNAKGAYQWGKPASGRSARR